MDIKRIRYAIALAEEKNFARAAEKLHLSQPALSRSIQTLEEELGLPLFERNSRSVELTAAGGKFLEKGKALLAQLRNLEVEMRQMCEGETGQVAFGVGPLPTVALVPQLLRSFRHEKPGIQLTITSNNWCSLLAQLRAEEIEFFVAGTRDIPAQADISITPLCRQYGSFMCRSAHPLLQNPQRTPADIIRYGLASPTLPEVLRATFRQLLGLASDAALPFVLVCDNVAVLTSLVRNDDVILVCTEAAVAQEIDDGVLVPLTFPGLPPLFSEIGMVQLVDRTLSPTASHVLAQLHAIAAQSPGTVMLADRAGEIT